MVRERAEAEPSVAGPGAGRVAALRSLAAVRALQGGGFLAGTIYGFVLGNTRLF